MKISKPQIIQEAPAEDHAPQSKGVIENEDSEDGNQLVFPSQEERKSARHPGKAKEMLVEGDEEEDPLMEDDEAFEEDIAVTELLIWQRGQEKEKE